MSEGTESANVDLVVQPTPVVNINVTIASSRLVGEIQLYQILLDDRLPILEKRTQIREPSTVTLDARAGRYRLLASAEVASSTDNVTRPWSSRTSRRPLLPATNMMLEPAVNIAGRVIFEGANPLRQDAGAWLVPMMPMPEIGIQTIGNATFTVSSGEFLIEGVLPGRYVIQAGGVERRPKSPWILKSAMVGGRDVLDEPIDLGPGDEINDVRLTVTERISELSGSVADATDKPSRDDSVVVFSADRRHWWPGSRRTRVVRPDAKGLDTVRAPSTRHLHHHAGRRSWLSGRTHIEAGWTRLHRRWRDTHGGRTQSAGFAIEQEVIRSMKATSLLVLVLAGLLSGNDLGFRFTET